MKVLVTGAAGQVGHEVVIALEDHHVEHRDHEALDVVDRDAVFQAVTSTVPDAVVHAAAWTAVDACEGDPDRAFAANAFGTKNIADAAHEIGAHVCYLSTDYVFDGTKPTPYNEEDVPNPQSVYGRSKLAGEQELGADDLIIRTSWVCGLRGSNMVKTVLRLAAEQDELSFVDDQSGHPTFADDLAKVVTRMVVEARTGIFHVTNQGAVSWYEFARATLESAGLDPDRVQPIATADLDPPRPAPRPANSVLDNAALRLSGISLLPDFHEPLGRLVKELSRA